MQPRYQCLSLGPAWSWRLLGSNHRELARSRRAFAHLEAASADALEVGAAAPSARIEILVGPGSTWRWTMWIDDEERAGAGVGYARRLECLRAVARFRECAPLATVAAAPLVRRGAGGDRRPRPAAQSLGDPVDTAERTRRPPAG